MDKKEDTVKETEKEKKSAKTVAEKIWDDIKNVELPLFALPGQTVDKHCEFVTVEPTKLYMVSSVGSILPALEEVFNKKYSFELAQKYIIVSKK